jgi:hypothetical protein
MTTPITTAAMIAARGTVIDKTCNGDKERETTELRPAAVGTTLNRRCRLALPCATRLRVDPACAPHADRLACGVDAHGGDAAPVVIISVVDARGVVVPSPTKVRKCDMNDVCQRRHTSWRQSTAATVVEAAAASTATVAAAGARGAIRSIRSMRRSRIAVEARTVFPTNQQCDNSLNTD